MKVIDLTNVRRQDAPVLYRRVFNADAVVEIMQETLSTPIEFVIEHRPLGGVDVRVTLIEDIDYPLIPVISGLKKHVLAMHESGSLP